MNFSDPFAHGAYLDWSDPTLGNGVLKFDTVDDEDIGRDAEIVEHPVETGVNIADHYRIKLNDAKLEAFISQEPVDPSLYPDAQGSVQTVRYQLPTYPAPSLAAKLVGAALSAGVVGTIAQSFAQSPPTTFDQRVLMYGNPVDTLAMVLGSLEQLRQGAVVVNVATRSWYYASMMLGPIRTRRNEKTGTGTIITLELRQVAFVSTSSVAAPPTPKKKKDAPLTNKGKQNPAPPTLQSFGVKALVGLGILQP